MELIQMLANSSFVKSVIGEGAAGFIKEFAAGMSLLPTLETPTVQQTQNPTPMATAVNEQSVEAQRLAQAPASQAPTVNVGAAPVNAEFKIENVIKLDGREINRSMTKQQIENAERAGMGSANPKNRQLLNTNGGTAAGFSR